MTDERKPFRRRHAGAIVLVMTALGLWAGYAWLQAAQPDDALADFRNSGWWPHRPFLSTDDSSLLMGFFGHLAGTAIIGMVLAMAFTGLARLIRPGTDISRYAEALGYGLAMLGLFAALRVFPIHVTEVYGGHLDVRAFAPFGLAEQRTRIETHAIDALVARTVVYPRYTKRIQIFARQGQQWHLLGERNCWDKPDAACLDRVAPEVAALATYLGRTAAPPRDEAGETGPTGSHRVVSAMRVWAMETARGADATR